MTTELTKAAQQALEALTELLPDKKDPNHGGHDARDVRKWRALVERLRALTQRPAAQEVKRPQNCGTSYCSCIECVMEPAPQQATPEPLIVKGAMAGMVDAQVRDLWPTKGATPEPVGEYRKVSTHPTKDTKQ